MATKASDSGGSEEIPPFTPTPSTMPETPSGVAAAQQSTQPPSSSSDIDSIDLPSYSRWFSWTDINEREVQSLPEFFDSRFSSKNPKFYLNLRNSMIKQFRDDHPRKISFTDVQRTLVGDVVSIRRVFDFLDSWGLINYTSSATTAKPVKWDEFGNGCRCMSKETSKRICNGCKSVCIVACFVCDKYDLKLCARCYIRANYCVGIISSEFKRVELSEETFCFQSPCIASYKEATPIRKRTRLDAGGENEAEDPVGTGVIKQMIRESEENILKKVGDMISESNRKIVEVLEKLEKSIASSSSQGRPHVSSI